MRIGPLEISLNRRRARVREFGIQSVGDIILQLEALLGNSSTNRYTSRASQAAETLRKYRGQSVKGNQLVKNLINTRAVFTVGRGLIYTGPEAETAFVNEFFRANKLGLNYLQQLARERCFEGQALLLLARGDGAIPRVRYLSWLDTSYELIIDPLDYGDVREVRYRAGTQEARLRAGEFAFFKFDTRLNSYEGTPLLAGILNTIEDLDDALTSWRTINNKFSNPTAYFKFENEADAEAFQERLKTLNWQWGDSLAGAGDGTVLQIGYGPYTSMLEEINVKAKIVSGHTGVPIQYMGFADLLNNRAVADDLQEMFVTVSENEQAEWASGFTDLIGRAMALYNAATGSTLNFKAGRVRLELVSDLAYKRIVDVWLPLYLDGAITLETLLLKVPGVDEQKEAAAVRRETAARGGTPRQGSAVRSQGPRVAVEAGGVM